MVSAAEIGQQTYRIFVGGVGQISALKNADHRYVKTVNTRVKSQPVIRLVLVLVVAYMRVAGIPAHLGEVGPTLE